MPSLPAFNKTHHAVLRGVASDDIFTWREELRETSKATGCHSILFPSEDLHSKTEDILARAYDGTWQSLAYQIQVANAIQILTHFISGPVWALMLTNRPGAEATRLLHRPGEVMSLVVPAASALAVAPVSERQKSRLIFELANGDVDDYPSGEHYRDAMEWLEVVVHLSADVEAVELRQAAHTREVGSSIREAAERVSGQEMSLRENLFGPLEFAARQGAEGEDRERRRSVRRPREQADVDGPELPRRVRNKREG